MDFHRFPRGSFVSLVLSIATLFLIVFFAYWAYLPGIDGPALLDDRSNIPVIDRSSMNLRVANNIVFGNRSGPLGRPVAMASFVGEALLWGSGPSTGKAVNLGIHLANSILVFLLLIMILKAFKSSSPRACALAAAMLWCWAPLQLSTVLYHVQRMTLLCSFFMLLTMLFALQWRACFEAGLRRHFAWAVAAVCTALLALYSKENAATLVLIVPALLALYPNSSEDARGAAVSMAFSRLFLLLAVVLTCVLALKWSWVVGGYHVRDYTVAERALSQPRILFDYMQQFFWPQSWRLGLVHDDFQLSSGLISPPATLMSIVFFGSVLTLAIWKSSSVFGKQLLVCVAIFLLGHSVESTVLALEPYFEHRNYFPSVGLALGAALLISACLKKAPAVRIPLLVWFAIYGGSLLVETGAQAVVWSKHELIVLHDVNGHPESPRANRAMALMLAQSHDLDLALKYSDRAYPNHLAEPSLDGLVYAMALSCVSGQPLVDRDVTALNTFSGLSDRAAREAMQLIIDGVYDQSCDRSQVLALADRLAHLAKHTPTDTATVPLLSTMAVLENALERYPGALWYTEEALSHSPDDIQLLLMSLHFCAAERGVEECPDKMAKLRALEQNGRLSREQTKTLALYSP